MKTVVVLFSALIVLVTMVLSTSAAETPNDDEGWSQTVQGLQARVTLVQKPKLYGTRWLVPYLNLRNVSDSASPIQVRCSTPHVKFELVDADGRVVANGQAMVRSGPHADPGTVSLPLDSFMRISMECRNWGIHRNSAAMISTDTGAWNIKPDQKGKVFLRATLTGKELKSDAKRTWYGTIETPLVKVDWKE